MAATLWPLHGSLGVTPHGCPGLLTPCLGECSPSPLLLPLAGDAGAASVARWTPGIWEKMDGLAEQKTNLGNSLCHVAVPHSPVPSWALPLPRAASSQYPLEGPLCDSPSWGKHLQLQPALATGGLQGQGMLRLEGSLKFISFQTPPMVRDISHYTRMLQAPSNVVLNTSRDGATSYSPAVGKMSSSSQGNLRWDRDAVGHWWVGWRIGRAPRGAERPLPE